MSAFVRNSSSRQFDCSWFDHQCVILAWNSIIPSSQVKGGRSANQAHQVQTPRFVPAVSFTLIHSVRSSRLIRGSFTLIRFHTRTVHSVSQRTRDLTVSLTLTRSHMRAALSLSQLISLSRCIRSHLPPHAHRAHSLTQFIHSQVPFTCTGAAQPAL